MNAKRNRPDAIEAAPKVLADYPDSPTDREISFAAERFRNAFAVLVRGKTIRRHLYFNLPAAERAVRRARARGDTAAMVLVMLVPVDGRKCDKSLRRPAETDDMLRALDDVWIADTTEAVIGDD